MSDVPLPEPSAWQVRRNDYGLWASQYWEECSEWEAKNCVAAADLRQLYTADQLHAHAVAVSAAKDAEIAALRAEVAGLRRVVESAAAAEEFCADAGARERLGKMARAALSARKGEE